MRGRELCLPHVGPEAVNGTCGSFELQSGHCPSGGACSDLITMDGLFNGSNSMTASASNPPGHEFSPMTWLGDRPTSREVDGIVSFLTEQGTFRFPTISSGLFSAAAAENPEFRLTGYQNIWTRDNCHIANALWVTGHKELAIQATASLLEFYRKHAWKFRDVISGKADPSDPMQRPHIRFDGESLAELDVRWAHAQNDALGYFLWLACKLIRAGDLIASPEDLELFGLFVDYFAKIEYWQDEDSGHWEEARKIEASSIGPVVAGLTELRALLAERSSTEQVHSHIDQRQLNELIDQGWAALREILPAECVQADPKLARRYDSALLFLIAPLELLDDAMAMEIVDQTVEHLAGPIGIRRYLGDSYWCANYRELLSPEVRTSDFSDDMSARDSLLKKGEEAQWCIFDPIISVIYGERYLKTKSPSDRDRQVHHLRRSLGQLTGDNPRFPKYRCPESYFLERGEWVPNDITPLLWSQANLLLALHVMKQTADTSS